MSSFSKCYRPCPVGMSREQVPTWGRSRREPTPAWDHPEEARIRRRCSYLRELISRTRLSQEMFSSLPRCRVPRTSFWNTKIKARVSSWANITPGCFKSSSSDFMPNQTGDFPLLSQTLLPWPLTFDVIHLWGACPAI